MLQSFAQGCATNASWEDVIRHDEMAWCSSWVELDLSK